MLALYLSMCSCEEDQGKIKYIYDNYRSLIYKTAYSIVNDREVMSDIIQETMVGLTRNVDTIRIDGTFPIASYVRQAAKNAAKDYVRKLKKYAALDIEDLSVCIDLEDPSLPVLDVMMNKEDYETVVGCICALPDTYKEVIYQRYVCEQSDKDIAAALHLSHDTVRMRLSRGRVLLQEKLQEVRKSEK